MREFARWYFEPKAFETAGDRRLYRYLGIRLFKRYLPTSGDLVSRWRGVTRIARTPAGVTEALRRYERTTRSYEARHIVGGVLMLGISWWSTAIHGKGEWLPLLAFNAVINGYPIMPQRYDRTRLLAAISRRTQRRSPRPGHLMPQV